MLKLIAVIGVLLSLSMFWMVSANYKAQEEREDTEDMRQALLEDFSLQQE